jgi:hypothetical protein
LRRTGSLAGLGDYYARDLIAQDFTGAAISSLSSNQPFWQIRLACKGYTDSGTIGVALDGWLDDSDIDVHGHGVQYVLKLGLGANNAHVRGANVHTSAYTDHHRAPIWVVPAPTATNAGTGFVIERFKFGPENYDARDFRLLYADEDAATGTDFATRTAATTVASTGFIIGHVVHSSEVGGQGAIPAGPFVFSTTPNVRGCWWGNLTVLGTVPDYWLKYLTAPAADRTTVTNLLGPILCQDTETPSLSGAPTNGPGTVKLIDPDGQMSRFADITPMAYLGGQSVVGFTSVIGSMAGATLAGGASKTTVTDSVSGTDANEITYASGSDALNFTVSSGIVANYPLWLEFDLKAGSSSALTDVELRAKYGSGGGNVIHFRHYVPVPASGAWRRFRFLLTPREFASAVTFGFYPHNQTAGLVQIGRVRLYHAREPVNVDGRHVGMVVAPGGVVTKTKAGTPTDSDLAFAQDGALITDTSANKLWMRSGAAWVQTGSSGSNEFGGLALATGEETLDRRWVAVRNLASTSGIMHLTYFQARKTETSTQGRVITGDTAAVTVTHAMFGVYSVAANGDLTLVATTADDTTLFAAVNTAYTRSWTASFTKTAGVTYAWARLIAATTMPTFMGANPFSGQGISEGAQSPRITGANGSGLTALPSSVTAGSVSLTSGYDYAVILP